MDFKVKLASALVLNIVFKIITFALTTTLTRQLTPSENGINFSCQLYFNTVLFLARECIRSVNVRHNLQDKKGSGIAVLKVMNCAAASVPLGIIIIVVLEILSWCGIRILPSLTALSHVGEKSININSTFLVMEEVGGGGGGIGLPELIIVLSIIIILSIEPCIAIVQSFDCVRIIVASEFWALLARLLVTLLLVKGIGGLSSSSSNNTWTARMCFATGIFAFSLAMVIYFTWIWNKNSNNNNNNNNDNDDNNAIQQARADAARVRWGITPSSSISSISSLICWQMSLPWCFLSYHATLTEVLGTIPLLLQFLRESFLRLILSEGEHFALAACGSAAVMGRYDLLSSLGALAARVIFRVWEAACFTRWSRDAAAGHHPAALALLKVMLRAAAHFGGLALLLAGPLAGTFLKLIFSQRWAGAGAVRALSFYGGLLPLMGWYGLLDAFVRATAQPVTLQRTQHIMLAHTIMYVSACFVLLRLIGKEEEEEEDTAVMGLIILNGVSMGLRCVESIAVLLMSEDIIITSSTSSCLDEKENNNNSNSAIKHGRMIELQDFKDIFYGRIAAVWVVLFVYTRWSDTSGPILAFVAGTLFTAAVIAWDIDMRRMVLGIWHR